MSYIRDRSAFRSTLYLLQDLTILATLYALRPYFCFAWWAPTRLLWWNLVRPWVRSPYTRALTACLHLPHQHSTARLPQRVWGVERLRWIDTSKQSNHGSGRESQATEQTTPASKHQRSHFQPAAAGSTSGQLHLRWTSRTHKPHAARVRLLLASTSPLATLSWATRIGRELFSSQREPQRAPG